MCPADVKRNISREIDVMVSDSEGELPWFAEGDLIIAPPSSVVAQIHIKTEFDVKELGEVLESGTENQRVYDATTSGRSLWFGAVFFSRTKAQSNDKMRKIWCSAVKKANGGGKRVGIPDCVAMIDGPVFLRKRNMGQMAEPCFGVTAYDCGNAAPAVFLSHFFDSVSLAGKDSTRRGEWFRMVTQLCKGVLFDESF
jgi:hypothetical protein